MMTMKTSKNNPSVYNLRVGDNVTVDRQYLVAESDGYWSWENEVITGTVKFHHRDKMPVIETNDRGYVTLDPYRVEILSINN